MLSKSRWRMKIIWKFLVMISTTVRSMIRLELVFGSIRRMKNNLQTLVLEEGWKTNRHQVNKSNLTFYSEYREGIPLGGIFTLNINLSSLPGFSKLFSLCFSPISSIKDLRSNQSWMIHQSFPRFDVYRCFRKHTFTSSKRRWSREGRIILRRKTSSIFKTSRRCDHMMILWWLYNDHMIINDHMMIVCKFRGDTARNWGRFFGKFGILGTRIHLSWVPKRIWGWGSRLWVLRFCGGSETQVLRLKVFGSSHATQVQVHMQLKFKFTNSRIWNFFQSPLPSSLVGKTAEVFITHTPLIVWNKENIETLK